MFVRNISIMREGDYGYGAVNPTKPLLAKIKVEGQNGSVELNLSPDLSRRVVEIIAEEVAAAGRATAEAMTADILTLTGDAPAQIEGAF
jgi:hypothetical protein